MPPAYPGAWIRTEGKNLHLSELREFLTDIEQLESTLQGRAELDCMEAHLTVELVMGKRGDVDLSISLTPDTERQKHRFLDEIDQSYFPKIASAWRAILTKYPIRGEPR